jgi:hypothetical protein
MNRERDVNDTVNRWLDEGADRAPERFVWAALEEAERTPQRGAWRVSLENLNVPFKFSAPVLGVAAALALAVAVGAFVLSGRNIGGPSDPSPTPEASSAAAPAASAEACGQTSITRPVASTIEVEWCFPRGGGEMAVVHFTMEAPPGWEDGWFAMGSSLWLRPEGQGAIAFQLDHSRTADEWVEDITGTQEYLVTDPEPITVDGAAGYVVDLSIAPGTSSADAPPVIEESDQTLRLQTGSRIRMWVVDRDGGALAIATGAPGAESEEWAATVGEAVQTIEWAP